MKIKSAILTQASGSVGGLTASHNRGGMYFRSRAIPVNPATAAQVAIRNAMSVLATAWQETLTAAQREAWTTYAENVLLPDSLGEPRNVGGVGMYVRSNVPRIQVGLPRVDDGPTTFDQGTFTLPTPTVTAGSPATLSLVFDNTDAWANEDDAALLVYGSREQAASINFFKGPYRFGGMVEGDGTTAPTSPATPALPFAGTAGNAMFLQVRVTRADGRLSPISRFRTVIAA